jgi:dTDP-4-amino-4,6-dideoxygalactose transaminase
MVFESLIREGINVNLHYIPVYRHPFFERMGFEKGYCPEAESFFKSAISIPIYPSLTDSQQEFAIERIREAVN